MDMYGKIVKWICMDMHNIHFNGRIYILFKFHEEAGIESSQPLLSFRTTF